MIKIIPLIILTFIFSGCELFIHKPTEPPPKVKADPEPSPSEEPAKPKVVIKYKPRVCPVVKCPVRMASEKMLVGEVEYVSFIETGINLPARIDTGATTSSLGVKTLELFERDGDNWVKFSILNPANGQVVELRSPVVRKTRIKNTIGRYDSRVVVSLQVKMGELEEQTEFTLAHRDKYKYPVLVGRSLLRGAVVVDVGQRFLLSSGGEEE